MKKEYSAGIVVYFRKHNEALFLLLHYTAGHWDFPKGHMEAGETKEETALRELQEETGLTATIDPGFHDEFSYFFHDYTTKELLHKTVYFFMGESQTKDVIVSDEHVGFEWLPYEKALEQLTYKNARDLLCKVHKNLN